MCQRLPVLADGDLGGFWRAQSSLPAAGVLEMILAKLGATPRFKRSANLLALEARLAPLTLVLVLDDAHN